MISKSAIKMLEIHSFASSACRIYPCKGATWAVTFRDVKMRCSLLDLAILPIGAYAPRWFMKDQHIDPTEAVQIMLDCGAAQALGVHWGTFSLTDESRMAPKNSLLLELAQRGLPDTSFIALEPGEIWSKKRELAQEN